MINVLPKKYNKSQRRYALHRKASTMQIACTGTLAFRAAGSAAKAVLLSVDPMMAHTFSSSISCVKMLMQSCLSAPHP